MGQDQVCRKVSLIVLCWHAVSVANALWKYRAIWLKRSNSVVMSSSVKRVMSSCNVWSMEGATTYGHAPECRVTSGGGSSYCLLISPYRPFLRDYFKRSLTTSEKLIWKYHHPKTKHSLEKSCHTDKNNICGRRRDIATQERNVCDVERENVSWKGNLRIKWLGSTSYPILDIKLPNDTDLPRYEFWPPKVLASIK